MVMSVLEGTFAILILGLILANAQAFGQAVTAISGAYTGAVRALAGVAHG